MTNDQLQRLRRAAENARDRAYAPYSGYTVGVALLDDQQHVVVGCNVENASYPEGTCAESGAIAAMIANGGRHILDIVIVGGGERVGPCAPCGGCRQRISEFSTPETSIWLLQSSGEWKAHTMADLLPGAFTL